MAREFNAGSLADGQLQDAQTALYTVPAGVSAPTDIASYIRSLSLYNTNAAQQTILLWIQRSGGTARRWRPRYVLEQNESAEVLGDGETLMLSPGDAILGQTTTDNGVDFVITGVHEIEP